MTGTSLSAVVGPAIETKQAVAGLVVLGWKDAADYVEPAEETGTPTSSKQFPFWAK